MCEKDFATELSDLLKNPRPDGEYILLFKCLYFCIESFKIFSKAKKPKIPSYWTPDKKDQMMKIMGKRGELTDDQEEFLEENQAMCLNDIHEEDI